MGKTLDACLRRHDVLLVIANRDSGMASWFDGNPGDCFARNNYHIDVTPANAGVQCLGYNSRLKPLLRVAWMKCNAIRGVLAMMYISPDCALLHPGYGSRAS